MRHLRSVLIVLAVGVLSAAPLPWAAAQTAPRYQSSDPGKGEMMDHPPSEVTVTFDQPLDQSSWMNVLDDCGNEIDSGPATVELNEMTVGIGKTPSGMYKVVYRATGLGGATGSSSSSFEFMVHHGKSCDGKKKHDHRKKDEKKHDHDDRDDRRDHGHDDGAPDHSGHMGMPGSGSMGHTGHTMASDSGHTGDHGGDHRRHGGDHPRTPPSGGGGGTPPLAGGPAGSPAPADAEAVLIGLGLALAVGVLGGWLLRMSSKLAETA